MKIQDKIVTLKKPEGWHMFSPEEQAKFHEELITKHDENLKHPPIEISIGTYLTAKRNSPGLTGGWLYKVKEHYACLYTTYSKSEWQQFFIMEDNFGNERKYKIDLFELNFKRKDVNGLGSI